MSTIASNGKKLGKHCDWAFDFKTRFASFDDYSDSDSDDQKLASTPNTRASARLLTDDLDLSTREEHVTYKPNPFSIAKINAAYRPTSTVNGSVLQPAQPVRPTDKPTQNQQPNKRSRTDSGQTTIMEGFRTQAMKKPRTNALQLRVPLRSTTNPKSVNSSLTVNKSVAEKPVVSVSPTKSTLSTAVLASPSVSIAMVSNASDFPSISSCLPEHAHTLPPKASQHHDAQTLSKISRSRAFAPPPLLPDILHNQRKRTDNRRPVFSSFSSPGHPYSDGPLNYDPHIIYSQTYSSPIKPVRKSSFCPYLPAAQPFPRKYTEKGFVPSFIKAFDTKRVSVGEPSSLIVKVKDQSDHSEKLELLGDYGVRANETPEFPNYASTSKPWHPAQSLNQRQLVEARPANLLPSPSLISGTSPSPSNYLARRRIPDDSSSNFTEVTSYPKYDAYQYPTEDPDEEWTTLPSRKKRKPNIAMPVNPTYNKSFRIPGLRLPPTMKAETNATTSTRRVKVYLPPPPNSVDVRCPSTNKNSGSKRTGPGMKEMDDRKDVGSSSPTNFDADAYPSPSTSNLKLSLSSISQVKETRNYAPPPSRYGVLAVAPYRPPSPPTSDLPSPDDALDVHLEVDYEGIQLRYPEMKRLSRKRRCSSAEVWNLLGVDSCGHVWKDVQVDDSRHGEEAEIQIIVWTGHPSA